jgi:hypothetical protein
MAATNVYANICRIPRSGGTSGQCQTFTNLNATSGTFVLYGGEYCIDVLGSTFGTVTLQRLGPDGSTWLTALTAFAANGTATADLPPGQYRVALA